MEAGLALCAAVLKTLCEGFGEDNPVSRRAACLRLCETEVKYNQVIEKLASKGLLDVVHVPNAVSGQQTLYPILHYGTLRLIKASTAEHVLVSNISPIRRQ